MLSAASAVCRLLGLAMTLAAVAVYTGVWDPYADLTCVVRSAPVRTGDDTGDVVVEVIAELTPDGRDVTPRIDVYRERDAAAPSLVWSRALPRLDGHATITLPEIKPPIAIVEYELTSGGYHRLELDLREPVTVIHPCSSRVPDGYGECHER